MILILNSNNIIHIYNICITEIILVHPKSEIDMMLSNSLFFQYCDISIELFSIAPCIVIFVNYLCFISGMISLLVFFISLPRSSNYCKSNSCCSFSLLQAIAISFPLLFAIAFKIKK